ncbi:hypothetical protein AHAS_Ahas17G0273000 [Arachis hypogaea]
MWITSDFNRYDEEAIFFDESFVYPAYTTLLGHLRSKAVDDFKAKLEQSLNNGEGFASSVHMWTESIMLEFEKGSADAAVRQASWSASKVKDKLRHDIESHASSVRDTKKLLKRETEAAVSELSACISGFELDEEKFERMQHSLRDYVKEIVENKAKEESGKILIRMKDRFSTVFNHDADSLPRSLKLLSDMAAICLEDEKPDRIENVLHSSFIDRPAGAISSQNRIEGPTNLLASSTWEEVHPKDTLITPVQCKSLWRQFQGETEYTVTQAISAQGMYAAWSSIPFVEVAADNYEHS